MHNNSYKLNFLHVAYKKAEMPCKYKGVNYLNVNHTQLTAKRLRDTLFKKNEELNGNDKRIKERCCDLSLLEEVSKHYDNH